MADGLTKISARQLFSDRSQIQQYRLVHDETYTAAKKKLENRKQSERESCYYIKSENEFDNMCLCFHSYDTNSHSTGHSFDVSCNFSAQNPFCVGTFLKEPKVCCDNLFDCLQPRTELAIMADAQKAAGTSPARRALSAPVTQKTPAFGVLSSFRLQLFSRMYCQSLVLFMM